MAYCRACESPRRLELDQFLVQNGSCRAAAKEFGLSKSAVERHKNGHLRPCIAAGNIMGSNSKPVPVVNPKYAAAAPAMHQDPDLDLPAVKRHLNRAVVRLAQAVDEAADSGTFQGLSSVAGQLIKALDRVCELEGFYPEKTAAMALPVATGFAVQIVLPAGAHAPSGAASIVRPPSAAPVLGPIIPNLDLPPIPAHLRGRNAGPSFGGELDEP